MNFPLWHGSSAKRQQMRYRHVVLMHGYVCTFWGEANCLRREKPLSQTSVSIQKGAKLAEVAEL